MRSELTYERLSHGEITAELDARDTARLQTMGAEDQEFLARHPQAPLPRPKPRMTWAISAAAAVLLVVIGWGIQRPEDDTRIKSADQTLLVYHKTSTGSELLVSTSLLGGGDEIQLAYYAAKKRYGVILSIDGRGSVTTHLPLHGPQALPIETTKPELLPYSYRLDDAPDFETLFLITSDQPFTVAQIKPFLKAVASATTPLHLPDGFTSTAFRITKKETSP